MEPEGLLQVAAREIFFNTNERSVLILLLDKEKAGSGFSSLIVGVKEKQNYKFIGLVETGITRNVLTTAKAREKSIFSTEPNVNRNSPFRKKIKQAEIIWLEPDIKCKVKYLELDKFGMMRHASFRGLAG